MVQPCCLIFIIFIYGEEGGREGREEGRGGREGRGGEVRNLEMEVWSTSGLILMPPFPAQRKRKSGIEAGGCENHKVGTCSAVCINESLQAGCRYRPIYICIYIQLYTIIYIPGHYRVKRSRVEVE